MPVWCGTMIDLPGGQMGMSARESGRNRSYCPSAAGRRATISRKVSKLSQMRFAWPRRLPNSAVGSVQNVPGSFNCVQTSV